MESCLYWWILRPSRDEVKAEGRQGLRAQRRRCFCAACACFWHLSSVALLVTFLTGADDQIGFFFHHTGLALDRRTSFQEVVSSLTPLTDGDCLMSLTDGVRVRERSTSGIGIAEPWRAPGFRSDSGCVFLFVFFHLLTLWTGFAALSSTSSYGSLLGQRVLYTGHILTASSYLTLAKVGT